MEIREQLYEGKAKKVFATEDPELVLVDYKDDATAGNGAKKVAGIIDLGKWQQPVDLKEVPSGGLPVRAHLQKPAVAALGEVLFVKGRRSTTAAPW